MAKARNKKPDSATIAVAPISEFEAALGLESFESVIALIEAARRSVYQQVNSELADLYLELGEFIGEQLGTDEPDEATLNELAAAIAHRFPGIRGFTRRNLLRMREFYYAYEGENRAAALLAHLPWRHHILIVGHTKQPEERLLYSLVPRPARPLRRKRSESTSRTKAHHR